MKNRGNLVLIIGMLLSLCSKAQQPTILYTDFEPDLQLLDYNTEDTLKMDFDCDGITDAGIFFVWADPNHWYPPVGYFSALNEDWEMSVSSQTDTISSPHYWTNQLLYETGSGYYELCVRHKVGNDYCYGWVKTGFRQEILPGTVLDWMLLDKYAFCTIPNYPLVWGQTELYENVSECGTVGFASVVPNPTTGIFTVTGEKLRQIEIFDVLGQRITSLTANNDQTTIDLSGQPAGVYLVNVTDKEGRQCIRKVVKQ